MGGSPATSSTSYLNVSMFPGVRRYSDEPPRFGP
jgi:hypothetical protein